MAEENDHNEEQPQSSSAEVQESANNSNPRKRVPQEDEITTIIFGPSMIEDLIDCLRISVTDAIAEAVSSLPLLKNDLESDDEDETGSSNSSSGYHKLFRRLNMAYELNLDRFVVYARRNLFSIPARQSRSAMQIISTFQQLPNSFREKDPDDGEPTEVDQDQVITTDATTPEQMSPLMVPGLNELPTNEEQHTMEDELEQMRSELRKAKRHGAKLRCRLDHVNRSLHLSEATSRGLKRQFQDVGNANGLRDTIQEVAITKEELATIYKEGKALIIKLDSLEQSDKVDEELESPVADVAESKQSLVDSAKPLVEERCEAIRMHNIRTDDAARLANLLKKKE